MRNKKITVPAIFMALSALLLAMSWKIAGFSDLYVKYVFPVWGNTYGRVFGYLPFSVGELLIYGAVAYVTLYLVLCLARLVLWALKKNTLKKAVRINSCIIYCLVAFVAVIQVLNCFVLYHTTPVFSGSSASEYSIVKEDLVDLREKLVKRANELSVTFERDEKGNIVFDGDIGKLAGEAMLNLSTKGDPALGLRDAGLLEYKLNLLKGIYTRPKPFLKSDFFSQQGIMGYYFPFSLEANYNGIMYIANFPSTMCHELSHLKGFIFEDEASFIAYLACIESNNTFFEYSGILGVLGYVLSDCEELVKADSELRKELTPVTALVAYDTSFLTEETWKAVEEDAFFKTETVNKASEEFLDTNLTLNGVESGIMSYSEIVGLLLKYYYGAK